MSERLKRLAELGFAELNDWQTDPPVQVTGRITPDGHAFYLRLRSGSAQIEIHSGEALDSPLLWQGETEYVEQPDPCLFPASTVAGAAAELLRQWRSGAHPWPRWPPDR